MKERMKEKYTYKKVSKYLIIALISSFVLLVLAAYLPIETFFHNFTMTLACLILVTCLIIMMIWFKCPACGSRFIRRAFSRTSCPDCGYTWGEDFELGKKVVYKGKKKPTKSNQWSTGRRLK